MVPTLLQKIYGVLAALVFALAVFALIFPLVILGPTLPIRRSIGRHGARLAFACIGVHLRVRGAEKLPAGAAIVVANHASYVDGAVLTAVLPSRYTFVVQDGAAEWPYVGLVIKRMGVAFINRDRPREGAAQTRALLRRVQDGESLVIFAEGTFEAGPGVLAFKNGAFLLAARAGIPVVPVGIRGTRRFYGEGAWLPRWSPIEIEIGAAIPASHHPGELRDAARAAVLALCGEPDAARLSARAVEA